MKVVPWFVRSECNELDGGITMPLARNSEMEYSLSVLAFSASETHRSCTFRFVFRGYEYGILVPVVASHWNPDRVVEYYFLRFVRSTQ